MKVRTLSSLNSVNPGNLCKPHPTELQCTLLRYAAPSVLRCTLLNQTASYWAKLHPSHPQSYCTMYKVPYWTTRHPTELRGTLPSYAPSYYWATPHPTALRCTLLNYVAYYWATLYPPELHCIFLFPELSVPFWATMNPLGYTVRSVPNWAITRKRVKIDRTNTTHKV